MEKINKKRHETINNPLATDTPENKIKIVQNATNKPNDNGSIILDFLCQKVILYSLTLI